MKGEIQYQTIVCLRPYLTKRRVEQQRDAQKGQQSTAILKHPYGQLKQIIEQRPHVI